jgi:hypothetical protein
VKVYHRIKKHELNALYPSFRWTQYFTDSGASVRLINVAWPEFFTAMNATIDGISLEDWRTFLQWVW